MNSKFSFLKGTVPYAVAAGIFLVLSFAYFFPVLEGRHLPQSDDTHARGAARELVEFEERTGELPLWTNSMFGGMPGYQIKSDSSGNVFHFLDVLPTRLGLPYTTVAIMFLYLLGFYVLLRTLDVDNLLAIGGAIAFAFGSYNIIIIIAGHVTKAYAIALMAPVVAGVVMTFGEGRSRWAGALLTMVALGMEIAFNHVQITYYLALMIAFAVVARLVQAIRAKAFRPWLQSVAMLAVAAVLAALPSVASLWPTYEYGSYSIRGASELRAPEGEPVHSGLDKDYALAWSYGLHETPTLLVPNIVGGASEAIGTELKSLKSQPRQIAEAVSQQSSYWGGRSFTSGPVYVGAIVCFLFFVGAFFYRGRERWWLIAVTVFAIMLAWGKNFLPLTDFMFYHFPLYNKFRTVEMALVIATVSMPMLGLLGLKTLYDAPELVRQHPARFFGAVALTGGLALVLWLMPTAFYSFLSADEVEIFAGLKAGDMGQLYAQFESALVDARVELMRADALRSALLVLLASATLWFYSSGKVPTRYAMLTLTVLILIDLWSVDKRYLSSSDFVAKRAASAEFAESAADKIIKADVEPRRVIALYTNPFNEVFTSYHHQSVGGYHGAKLRRYQDVIDRYLMAEWQSVRQALGSQSMQRVDEALAASTALNMLNTRYLIYNPQQAPIVNEHALGAAWFVSDARTVASADEAIEAIGTADLRRTAILETPADVAPADSLSAVERTSYHPDRLTYSTSSTTGGMVVFSEIYYPAGWRAFVDGAETPIVRADYILRAVEVPAGDHTVEFRFEPQSFAVGHAVAWASSGVVVALLAAAAGWVLLRRKKSAADEKK